MADANCASTACSATWCRQLNSRGDRSGDSGSAASRCVSSNVLTSQRTLPPRRTSRPSATRRRISGCWTVLGSRRHTSSRRSSQSPRRWSCADADFLDLRPSFEDASSSGWNVRRLRRRRVSGEDLGCVSRRATRTSSRSTWSRTHTALTLDVDQSLGNGELRTVHIVMDDEMRHRVVLHRQGPGRIAILLPKAAGGGRITGPVLRRAALALQYSTEQFDDGQGDAGD